MEEFLSNISTLENIILDKELSDNLMDELLILITTQYILVLKKEKRKLILSNDKKIKDVIKVLKNV